MRWRLRLSSRTTTTFAGTEPSSLSSITAPAAELLALVTPGASLLLALATAGTGYCSHWLLLALATAGTGYCWHWLLLALATAGTSSPPLRAPALVAAAQGYDRHAADALEPTGAEGAQLQIILAFQPLGQLRAHQHRCRPGDVHQTAGQVDRRPQHVAGPGRTLP